MKLNIITIVKINFDLLEFPGVFYSQVPGVLVLQQKNVT